MTSEPLSAAGQSSAVKPPTTAQLLDGLTRFDGPPEQFLFSLLALQCRIGDAQAGAILRTGAGGDADVLAVYPLLADTGTAPVWLAQAAESLPRAASGRSLAEPVHAPDDLYGLAPKRHLIMVPLRGGAGAQGLAAFVIEDEDPARLASKRERLETTVGFLSLYDMRLALQRREADIKRLRTALKILDSVSAEERFAAAATAFCDEFAAWWGSGHAALGFLRGRYVQVSAMSHTEKVNRRARLVQDIEAAMEECLDQDIAVVYPAGRGSTVIARSAAELSRRHGPSAVLSVPLRDKGEAAAVLTLDRPGAEPFTLRDLESVRLACDLCTPRLMDLYAHAHWLGANAAHAVGKDSREKPGRKRRGRALAGLLALAAAAFLVFAKGTYRVEAPFTLQATERRTAPAPFDGRLKEVFVEPGDPVEAGKTVLARFETGELERRLTAARADRDASLRQAATAMGQDRRGEAAVARAEADEIAAQIALLEQQIAQADVKAEIGGRVVSGDLRRRVGAPVRIGTPLFEISPVHSIRAELTVPEDQIGDVRTGQDSERKRGELATASHPERRFGFEVERINPVAEVAAQRNVFRVRVRLVETAPWMRPGMQGVARIDIGRRRYAWIWTRRLVNWLRMKLWL